MALLQVTPEMMRSTAQKIETALEHATVIANQYLANHEAMGAAWQGDGYMSSTNTAGKVQHGLVQATIYGNHLKDALIKAAMMMEQHEMDASHSFSSFGAISTYDHSAVNDLGSGVGQYAAMLTDHHQTIKGATDQVSTHFQGQAQQAFYEAQTQMLQGFEELIETVMQHGQTIHPVNASAHATDASSTNFFV